MKLLHLVGWFIWTVWWCTDLQTLNLKINSLRFATSLLISFPLSQHHFQESFSLGFVLQGTCQNSLLFFCCSLLRLLANTCSRRHILRGEMQTSEVESRVTVLTLPCMQQRQGYVEVQQQWLRLTVLTTYAYSGTYPFPLLYLRQKRMEWIKLFWMQDCLNWHMLNTLHHNCIYNRLPEDEPSVSKHVEDNK